MANTYEKIFAILPPYESDLAAMKFLSQSGLKLDSFENENFLVAQSCEFTTSAL